MEAALDRPIRGQLALRGLRTVSAILFAAVVLYYAINLYGLPKKLGQFPTSVIAAAAAALVLAAIFLPRRRLPGAGWLVPGLLLGAVLCTVPFAFAQKEFGNGDVSAILFTLNKNRTVDLTRIVLNDFPAELIEHLVVMLAGVGSALLLMRWMPGGRTVIALACLLAIGVSKPAEYLRYKALGGADASVIVLERDFAEPQVEVRPARKRNLILIYLESLERGYRVLPATAEAFAPLARLEDQGFSARKVQQVTGAHFTAGGLVASLCGVPLLSHGVFDTTAIGLGSADETGVFERFMPGITCLGDILARDGYTGSYLNGSDTRMFSINSFLVTHGFSRVVGMAEDARWAGSDERNIWGLNDGVLFAEARAEISRLQAAGDPFFLALLTTATHGPDGFADPACGPRPESGSGLPLAIACTAQHLTALLAEIDRMGLGEDTIIAVMSDHLAMPNTLRDEMRTLGVHRDNLFFMTGDGIAPQIYDRPATTLDIFPTLLEAMGYRLAGNRANLGVSLLSGQPTLNESLGREQLDRALSLDTTLQERIWAEP